MKPLTAAEVRVVENAKAFSTNTIAPNAMQWERDRAISSTVMRSAGELGLLGIEVPVEHGGLGLSFKCKARVAEVLAAADFGFSMSLINSHGVAVRLATIAPESIRALYLPSLLTGASSGSTALTEPGVGSDFAAITTQAKKVPGGWCLDGTKKWIVNAAQSEVIIVYAKTDLAAGANSIGAFLIDTTRPGFIREPRIDMAGQHSINAGGFRLEGYQARPEDLLIPPGNAFKSIMAEINGARTYVAAMCCGMVDSAINIASKYGQERKTFGKNLHQHQGWRWSLADAVVDLSAARLMVAASANAIDTGKDAQFDAAKAKIFATRMAERYLPAMMQAMGAEGLSEGYPFGRHMVGTRMSGFVDGTTEILLERVAKTLS